MDADLVGPAGGGQGFQQGMVDQSLQNPEMGLGGFALAVVHHGAVFMAHVDPERMAGGMLIPGRGPHHDGVLDLPGPSLVELDTELPMGVGRASEEHHPAGAFIQPVDHPNLSKIRLHLLEQIG